MYGNNPYAMNNPYINNFNRQLNIDTIDNEMANLQKLKTQLTQQPQQQTPNINQTFQLAPSSNNMGIKYVNSIEDVEKELTLVETAFISADLSKMFIKNAKGEIRTFLLEEQLPIDDKDVLIQQLKNENEKLRGMINYDTTSINDESVDTNADKSIKTKTTTNVSTTRKSKSKSK